MNEIFFKPAQEVPYWPTLSLLSWQWKWAGREQEGRAVQSNSQSEQHNPTAHWSIQITQLKPLILLPLRKKDRQTESKKEKREVKRFIRSAITIEICQRRDLRSPIEEWAEKDGGWGRNERKKVTLKRFKKMRGCKKFRRKRVKVAPSCCFMSCMTNYLQWNKKDVLKNAHTASFDLKQRMSDRFRSTPGWINDTRIVILKGQCMVNIQWADG